MVDLTSISAFLTGLSATIKFIKGSLEKIKDMAVREKVEELLNAIIPLQSHIIALQDGYFTCIKEKQNLEDKLREIEDWRKESGGYELKPLIPGVFAYVKKSERGDTGPVVYFCTKCFDIDHKKSILQLRSETQYGRWYKCHNCNSEITTYRDPGPLSYGL